MGRVILSCNDDHLAQLMSNQEQSAYVGLDERAKRVDQWFGNICQKIAHQLQIPLRAIAGTEIIKNEPNSAGQVEHMDAMGGVWNFFAPLVRSVGTRVKSQHYQDFPLNIGPDSTVPRQWSTLPDIDITWEVGDLFLLRSNAIHSGPPNGATRRYVLFGSEESLCQSEHTDTLVVTEAEFFLQKGDT